MNSSVVAERELLEQIVRLWAAGLDCEVEMRELRDALSAQPAEAEGVDFGFDDRSVKVSQEAYSIFLEREQHRLAALSAVTAERDRLQAALDDPGYQPKHSRRLIAQLRAEAKAIRQDAALGSAIQRACKDLPEGFILTVWLEKSAGTLELCLPDTDAVLDDFSGDTFAEQINEAIDAAMAAKEA